MVFISVNTPTKLFGVGAGRAANIQVRRRGLARCYLRRAD